MTFCNFFGRLGASPYRIAVDASTTIEGVGVYGQEWASLLYEGATIALPDKERGSRYP